MSMNVEFPVPLRYPSGKRRRDEGDAVQTKRIKDDKAVLLIRRALCAYAAERRARVERKRMEDLENLLASVNIWGVVMEEVHVPDEVSTEPNIEAFLK